MDGGNDKLTGSLTLTTATLTGSNFSVGGSTPTLASTFPGPGLSLLPRDDWLWWYPRAHLLTTGETYQDLGGDYFEKRRDPQRQVQHLVRKLAELGYQATLEPAAA